MEGNEERTPVLSMQALRRMPAYLYYLKALHTSGVQSISAAKAADYFRYSEIQVRKDFAAVSTQRGKAKTGFSVRELIDGIELYLGFRNTKEALLAGAGSMGRALLKYDGFSSYGLSIIAAFDSDPELIGKTINGKLVLSADKISATCRRMSIHIGIITVPSAQAQIVCDQFVAGGVKALWNFAPVNLSVPDGILVQNENMAVSLAILSKHLDEVINAED